MTEGQNTALDFPVLKQSIDAGMQRFRELAAAYPHVRALIDDEINGDAGLSLMRDAIVGMFAELGPDRTCSFLMPFAWQIDDRIVSPGGRVPLNNKYLIALVAVVDDGVGMAWMMQGAIQRNFDRREELSAAYAISVGGRFSKSPGLQFVSGGGSGAEPTTLFPFGGLPDEASAAICREMLTAMRF